MEELGIKSWDVGEDVMQKLDEDTIIHVLKLLDRPSDLAYAACVSRSWHKYVFEGNLWRGMCLKCFPEIGNFKCILDEPSQSTSSQDLEGKNHLYSHLLFELQSPPVKKSCIRKALHASSTDNYPMESIAHTLLPKSMYPDGHDGDAPSYWSSEGQVNADVPETLTYLLLSELCVVHEVSIRPFKAYFQIGDPIYSAKAVRFRFGYSQSQRPCLGPTRKVNASDYVWTYESPAFYMLQEDELQRFCFPRPVLCIGGIFQIEFNGRVQTQSTDSLYYICVSHVSVCGTPLFDFKSEGLDKNGEHLLKCSWKREKCSTCTNYTSSSSEEDMAVGSQRGFPFSETLNQIRTNTRDRYFNMFIRNLPGSGFFGVDDGDSEDERPL